MNFTSLEKFNSENSLNFIPKIDLKLKWCFMLCLVNGWWPLVHIHSSQNLNSIFLINKNYLTVSSWKFSKILILLNFKRIELIKKWKMCKYLYSEKYRIHTIDSEYKCCFYIGLALILEKIFTLLKTSICCTRLKALIMKSGIGTCINWCLTRFMKKKK